MVSLAVIGRKVGCGKLIIREKIGGSVFVFLLTLMTNPRNSEVEIKEREITKK